MPLYSPQTWEDDNTDYPPSAARFNVLERAIQRASIATVTTLPTTDPWDGGALYDGFEVYYLADATNGIKWHLVYRSASTSSYKWEFAGGPSLRAEVLTAETTTSSSYTDLATTGPSITLPALAGDWEIEFSARLHSTAADQTCFVAPKLGSAATSDNDRAGNASGSHVTVSRSIVRTGLAASATVKLQYKSNGSATLTASDRNLAVRPVRVI